MDITQEQLAEKIGVTTGSVGEYERGETAPSVETLKLLVEFLGIDPREVFSGEYDVEPEFVKLLYAFKHMTPVKRKFMLDFAQFLVGCGYDENESNVVSEE